MHVLPQGGDIWLHAFPACWSQGSRLSQPPAGEACLCAGAAPPHISLSRTPGCSVAVALILAVATAAGGGVGVGFGVVVYGQCHVAAQAVFGVPASKARPVEGGCHNSGRPVSDARSALRDSISSPFGFELRGGPVVL